MPLHTLYAQLQQAMFYYFLFNIFYWSAAVVRTVIHFKELFILKNCNSLIHLKVECLILNKKESYVMSLILLWMTKYTVYEI